MKIKRILVAGCVITIFDALVGAILCGGIFNWVYQMEPTYIWKPMEGAPSATFFLGAFLLSLVFAWIYALLKKGMPGTSLITKGLLFGLFVWALGTLPGMLATITFMKIAPTVVIYWTIVGLVQLPLKGLIVSEIYQ